MVNGNYLAETKSFRAEVNCNYEAVPQARDLMDGQKLTGLEGQGELVLHKVSSYVMNLLSKSLKAGKSPGYYDYRKNRRSECNRTGTDCAVSLQIRKDDSGRLNVRRSEKSPTPSHLRSGIS